MKRSSPSRRPATIRRRLLAIVLVPSVSLLSVALITAAYLAHQGDQARKVQSEVREASAPASAVVASLQEERRLSVAVLSGDIAGGEREQLTRTRAKVAAAWGGLQKGMADSTLQNSTDRTSPLRLNGADQGLAQLPRLRGAVDKTQLSVLATYKAYNQMIDAFGGSLRELARSAPNADAAYEQMTAVDLFQTAEALSRSVSLATVAVAGNGSMPGPLFSEYVGQVSWYHASLAAILPRLPADERLQISALTHTNAWQQFSHVEGILLRRGNAGAAAPQAENDWPPLSPQLWESSAKQINDGLTAVYVGHAASAAAGAEATVQNSLSRSLIIGLILLVVGLGVVWVAFKLSNELVRRLRALRNDTLALSEMRLPAVVERLRRGEDVDIAQAIPTLDHGDDEIGEVALAFNHAQTMAVEAAAQEATIRAGTKAVFLNIARRSQVISYRQLRILDQAERRQEDPEALNLLFQLDHLATRARRNAENLVILSGEQPGRRWRQPVTLIEVVRGAIAETEQYTRVSIALVPECSIEGTAVADMIHILAELVDNATAFAPPSGRVEIRGNVVGRGVVLEIEDQGLGIAPSHRDQLNEMLSEVPEFSVMALSAEPRLGLFVVARLASRHGIQVTLQESHAYGGTRVVVLVPAAVIADSSSLGELGMLPAASAPRVTAGGRGSTPGSRERLAIPQEIPVTVPVQSSPLTGVTLGSDSYRSESFTGDGFPVDAYSVDAYSVDAYSGDAYSGDAYSGDAYSGGGDHSSSRRDSGLAASPRTGQDEADDSTELTAYELMFQPRPPDAAPTPSFSAPPAESPPTPVPPTPPTPTTAAPVPPPGPATAPIRVPPSAPSPVSPPAAPLPSRRSGGGAPVTPEPLPPIVVHSPVTRVSDIGVQDWPEPEPFGDRPPLPRRRRQTSLAPQLNQGGAAPMAEGSLARPTQPDSSAAAGASDPDNAERVRARFAAFQRGTQEGRSDDTSSDSP